MLLKLFSRFVLVQALLTITRPMAAPCAGRVVAWAFGPSFQATNVPVPLGLTNIVASGARAHAH
jgi:hypothetical protein